MYPSRSLLNSPDADDPAWIFNSEKFASILRKLEFPGEIISCLSDEVKKLKTSPERARQFINFYTDWMEGAGEEHPPPPPLWNALVVVSAFPKMLRLHQSRGITWKITADTMSDLPRRMKTFEQENGRCGFDSEQWMRWHMRGKIYHIGRLQYGIGKFYHPVNVYASPSGAVALMRPNITCDEAGWMIKKDAEGWKTSLTADEAGIHGHPIAPDGRVQRETITVPSNSPLLINAESDVLHIHIPSGSKLDPAACQDSLALARKFFPRHFPETKWAGFCCHAWLLDPALEIILPPASNLRAFAKMFRPLPANEAEELSYFYRVFGKNINRKLAAKMPCKTALQQAILDHVDAGRILRTGAGYIVI